MSLIPLNMWQLTAVVCIGLALLLPLGFVALLFLGFINRAWRLGWSQALHELAPEPVGPDHYDPKRGIEVMRPVFGAVSLERKEAPTYGQLDNSGQERSAPARDAQPRPEFHAPGLLEAPARFAGWQDGMGVMPDFELFVLTADIPGHPAGSTVSRRTLERLGYIVPPPPVFPK
jgi:hypothetical protein